MLSRRHEKAISARPFNMPGVVVLFPQQRASISSRAAVSIKRLKIGFCMERCESDIGLLGIRLDLETGAELPPKTFWRGT